MGLLSSLFGRSKKQYIDERMLFHLKNQGSDLSKPHEIEFFLYLPSQFAAEEVALHIRGCGFAVEVKEPSDGMGWLCFATKTMIPKLSDLHEIRRDFNSLTASWGGDYDGWGTPVVD